MAETESRKERKEKDKTRKEKIAGMFFNLTQITYTALVMGVFVTYSQGGELTPRLCAIAVVGGIIAYVWGSIGNNILK